MLKDRWSMLRAWRGVVMAGAVMAGVAGMAGAQQRPLPMPPGPYDVRALEGGVGLEKPLPADAAFLGAQSPWSLRGWVRLASPAQGPMLIAGVGEPGAGRFFAIEQGRLSLHQGTQVLRGSQGLQAGRWHAVAAVAHGDTVALYLDGRRIGSGRRQPLAVAPKLVFAPVPGTPAQRHFGGDIAGFMVEDVALTDAQLQAFTAAAPDPALTRFEDASPAWPVQTRQMAGQLAPQPAATLPRSQAPFSAPKARAPTPAPALAGIDASRWRVQGWQLASAEDVADDGASLSRADHAPSAAWRAATVPGTVLTTLVDRGVYPDPDHGLDNLAIPDTLAHHDWWYRTEFELPAAAQGRRLVLQFNGINYAGEIWVNGQHVGSTRGAFVRGRFEVGAQLHAGRNVVAVRVSPPPHPGIAHEQSISAGVGENGGIQALDGPTFIASEGWDWIPAVRDRNTGLWQDVELHASGVVTLGDAQVQTVALSADHQRAELALRLPLHHAGSAPVNATLALSFGDVQVRRQVRVPPGDSELRWSAQEVPELSVRQPRLWWPNGYGEAALYEARLGVSIDGQASDERTLRFGIRQVTYELSLFDEAGRLRRALVDYNARPGERIVDPRHAAIRPVPGGHAQSFYPGAERSPSVRLLPDDPLAPHLVLRVNGVRIATKGGNWGMDDWRKRVSRERLEPYFRLQRDAHLNVVRNWVGQDSEEAFYDLADEYGLMVLNDFWQSTQNYNIEPEDTALFLANAEEVVRRFAHHPSIVLWFGRNEGVPAPLLNTGLADVVARLDGTRWYTGSSNEVNLQGSGPYNYREPQAYFDTLARGFSVEVGTPSFSTLESFQASVAAPDQWPISDAWAYHDWHQSGNGDTASFMAAISAKLGAARDLPDFERKAQLLNYESHRAIFEGFNAGLWTRNSGRLLWMSHPAWPSNMWQIYSHDYDTHAAYYGVRQAAEPLHVQMNLPGHGIVVVNNTRSAGRRLQVTASAYASDGRVLGEGSVRVDAAAGSLAPVALPVAAWLAAGDGLGFVRLELRDEQQALRSRNFYWVPRDDAAMRRLDALPQVALQVQAHRPGQAGELQVALRNPSAGVVLGAKLTLVDAAGERILPVYYDDNYLNLGPGEQRDVRIRVDDASRLDGAKLRLRGWNVAGAEVAVGVP